MRLEDIIKEDELKLMIKRFQKSLNIKSEHFVKIERLDLQSKFTVFFNKKDKNHRAYNKDYKMNFYPFEFIMFLNNYLDKNFSYDDLVLYRKNYYNNECVCKSENKDIALKIVENFRKTIK